MQCRTRKRYWGVCVVWGGRPTRTLRKTLSRPCVRRRARKIEPSGEPINTRGGRIPRRADSSAGANAPAAATGVPRESNVKRQVGPLDELCLKQLASTHPA